MTVGSKPRVPKLAGWTKPGRIPSPPGEIVAAPRQQRWQAAGVLFCAVVLSIYLERNSAHHVVYGVPDRVSVIVSDQPITHLRVSIQPRMINGRKTMPTWRDVFSQYRLRDSIRDASIEEFNRRRIDAEPPAATDSPIPQTGEIVIELKDN